jgi:uncharacterized phage protein (TIGR01671 family)
MKREIKFRAWDDLNKVMLFYTLKELAGEDKFSCDTEFMAVQSGFDKYEWMQYTNLKDRDRDEIYEGDILSGHSDGNVKVVWVDDGWQCIFSDEGNITMAEMCIWFGNRAVIIGNIYENPELFPEE